jgi:hypothetical protein
MILGSSQSLFHTFWISIHFISNDRGAARNMAEILLDRDMDLTNKLFFFVARNIVFVIWQKFF